MIRCDVRLGYFTFVLGKGAYMASSTISRLIFVVDVLDIEAVVGDVAKI